MNSKIVIDISNIQAIGQARIELEENSITEFTGDNSNGKSILSKVIQYLTSGDIRHKSIRRALIKDGQQTGVVMFTHRGRQLGVILSDELKDSMITYNPTADNDNNMVVRYLSDTEGCDYLLKEFGFRTYADGDICLQLSPTFGAIPFITTSGAVNNAIVNDITYDRVAQNFLDMFKTVTFPTFRTRIDNYKKESEHLSQLIAAVEGYDWRAYEALQPDMQSVYSYISTYSFFQFDDIGSYANVKMHNVVECKLLPVHKPKIYEPAPLFTYIDSYDSLDSIRNGVCPVCNRRMVE